MIFESVSETCVSQIVELNGPALLFVRGQFGRFATLSIEASDDPKQEFLEIATATKTGVIPISFTGRYFLRLRFTAGEYQFGESSVSVSSNQSVEVAAL